MKSSPYQGFFSNTAVKRTQSCSNASRPLESKTLHSDINSADDVTTHGVFLGRGCYGEAYRIGDRVYKIINITERDADESMPAISQKEVATRSAHYWNLVYKKIYGGKFKHLATAKFQIFL